VTFAEYRSLTFSIAGEPAMLEPLRDAERRNDERISVLKTEFNGNGGLLTPIWHSFLPDFGPAIAVIRKSSAIESWKARSSWGASLDCIV
jgi:hypothetical protein